MNHPIRLRNAVVLVLTMCGCCALTVYTSYAQILPTHGIPKSEFISNQDETRLQAGPSASFACDFWSAGIPMVFQPLCNRLDDGSGLGYSLGGVFELMVSPKIRISVGGRFVRHTARFDRHELLGATRLGEGKASGMVVANIDSEIRYEAVQADLLFKYRLGKVRDGLDVIGIAVGPALSIPTRGTMSQVHSMDIYDSAGVYVRNRQFYGTDKERIGEKTLADHETMQEMRSHHFSMRTGIFYSFRLTGSFFIEPGIYADLPLQPFSSSDWGTMTSVEGNVQLLFAL